MKDKHTVISGVVVAWDDRDARPLKAQRQTPRDEDLLSARARSLMERAKLDNMRGGKRAPVVDGLQGPHHHG